MCLLNKYLDKNKTRIRQYKSWFEREQALTLNIFKTAAFKFLDLNFHLIQLIFFKI